MVTKRALLTDDDDDGRRMQCDRIARLHAGEPKMAYNVKTAVLIDRHHLSHYNEIL
jgi:hypothetical protein